MFPNRRRHTFRLRLLVILSSAFCFSVLTTAGLRAGAEDDAISLWSTRYAQAVRDLQFGNAFAKLEAARLMGAHRKSEFIRPLSEELLRDLDPSRRNFLSLPSNHPAVKLTIAWALGEIGHPHCVPELLKGVELVNAIVTEDIQATRERRTAELEIEDRLDQERVQANQGQDPEGYDIDPVIFERDRPGPFNGSGPVRHGFGYSPDMFWTVSDDFKASAGIFPNDEGHRLTLDGANWVNVARALFEALGKIGDERAIDPMLAMISAPDTLPIMRVYAAGTLGEIGTARAAEAMAGVYANEQDPVVRIQMAYAALHYNPAQPNYFNDLATALQSNVVRERWEAAAAFNRLQLGESEPALRAALEIEAEPSIRAVLEQAIYRAVIDNITPPNLR
ncbi:MAG: HEAT repeat domain-containing protein [Spirochaetales bacterium]|nr:HEAT repeat domain-containing protein [Leptospiraceae bacterium]MCP5483280.1 HEAT repeat domain-containing protein [Spirochaetales bacterium]